MSIQLRPLTPVEVATDGIVTNHGPGVLYYRATPPASPSVFDGSLPAGSRTQLAGAQSLVADGSGASVSVSPQNLTLDQKYQQRIPRLVGPALIGGGFFMTAILAGVVNQGRFCRAIIPESGTLHDLAAFCGVSGGNVIGCIYDCGEIADGVRTLLWAGSSVAASASAPVWQVLGDPNLPVTAGQHLDFGFIVDSTSSGWGRFAQATAAVERLPDGFGVGRTTVSPSYAYSVSMGAFAALPTIPEGSVTAMTQVHPMIARVT